MNKQDNLLDLSAIKTRRILTIIVVSLLILMENIDSNIINVAIPSIAKSFSISPLEIKSAVTSYLVSLAIFMPISGFIADKFGTRKVLFFAVFGFTLFSFLCGISNNIMQLVTARFLQGITGAFMLPVGRLLLLRVFGKQELVKSFVLISFIGAVGTLLAPVIGGVISTYFDWRFIFWINIPVGLFCFVVTYCYISNYSQPVKPFNWWAFVCLGIFLASLMYILDTIFDPVTWYMRLCLFAILIMALLLYIKFDLPAKNRIIDYSLFKLRTFRLCFFSGLLLRISFAGRAFLLALYFELALGLSPVEASYLLALHAVGLFIGRFLIRKLLHKVGFRNMLVTFNLLSSFTSFMLCLVASKLNVLTVLVLIINSMSASTVFLLLNTLLFTDVPEEQYADATSIANTMQKLSSSFGVITMAAVIFLANLFLPKFSYQVFDVAFIFIGVSTVLLHILITRLKQTDGVNLAYKE